MGHHSFVHDDLTGFCTGRLVVGSDCSTMITADAIVGPARVPCLQTVFRRAGVNVTMTVIPEPVDVRFFDPAALQPFQLPAGQLVFGEAPPHALPVFNFLSVGAAG